VRVWPASRTTAAVRVETSSSSVVMLEARADGTPTGTAIERRENGVEEDAMVRRDVGREMMRQKRMKDERSVRVMLPLDAVSSDGRTLRDGETLERRARALRACGARGVMCDVWWGIVEGEAPRRYEWRGYRELVEICARCDLAVDVVLSFHACGDSVGDGGCEIGLPSWATGPQARENMYADRRGNVTEEYLSLWGDETRDQRRGDRSPLECYRDFMADFAREFAPFLRRSPGSSDDPVITQVIVGLGPCGELRYPSYRATSGWHFPGVGEFQAYDERARMSLAYEAAAFGKPEWGRHPPTDGPSYNCDPEGRVLEPPRCLFAGEDEPDAKRQHTMTGSASDSSLTSASFSYTPASSSRSFFATDGTGTWNTARGQFFLSWYSQELVQHGERVLEHAAQQFADADAALGIKCAGVHWWHDHPSRAAQCTAGYFNAVPASSNDPDDEKIMGCRPRGYSQIIDLCARFGAELTFTCVEMRDAEHAAAYKCSPEGLLSQVLGEAHEAGVVVNGENALARFDDEAFAQILRIYGRGGEDRRAMLATASNFSLESRNSLSSDDSMMHSQPSSPMSKDRPSMGSFTYLRASDELFEPDNFNRFATFVRQMSV